MPGEVTLAAVFGLFVLLGATSVLSTFAATSRGIVPGVVVGAVVSTAIIVGTHTVGEELLATTPDLTAQLTVTAAAGAATGIVLAAATFQPADSDADRTDTTTDPTTYTNR